MAFGPDGYLYIGLGDGGAAGDPLGAGQNPDLLLGTIIRLDVSGDSGYAVPPDNPFVSNGQGAPEVWSYGWRNPWRFTFDAATGDMYIADVGQRQWEEVNFEAADNPGGLNYGWNQVEGTHLYSATSMPNNVVMPIAEYNHAGLHCSVTGGYVYRGDAIPDLEGVYLYSDFCSGTVWYAYRNESGIWQSDILLETGRPVSSFGQDEDGEMYLVDYSGELLKIVPPQ
jgi:glucose/arabinose dehydrogenase